MCEFQIQTEMRCQPDAGAGAHHDERAVADCAADQRVDAPARVQRAVLRRRRRHRRTNTPTVESRMCRIGGTLIVATFLSRAF